MNHTGDGARSGCPHFLKEMQSCGLPSEGIYLPLRAHIVSYCMTPMYRNCPTYLKYCPGGISPGAISDEKQNRTPAASDTGVEDDEIDCDGRRRHARIPEKRHVLLRSCDPLGTTVGDFFERAMTVDFSQGGMRVIINREIPPETPLLFDFDNDFMVPRLQGVAQLCWCRPLSDNPDSIEAGLVFKDRFSKTILSAELGN